MLDAKHSPTEGYHPMATRDRPERRPDREGRTSLTEALKSGIKDRGLTAYAVAKLAEVRPHVVQRFLNGERGLTLATADKLAGVLGLELCPREARPPTGDR